MTLIIQNNNLIPLREAIVGYIIENFFPSTWDLHVEKSLRKEINDLVTDFACKCIGFPDNCWDALNGKPDLILMKKYTKKYLTTSGREIDLGQLKDKDLEVISELFSKLDDGGETY